MGDNSKELGDIAVALNRIADALVTIGTEIVTEGIANRIASRDIVQSVYGEEEDDESSD